MKPHQTLRQALIDCGVIRPQPRYEGTGLQPVRIPREHPCLRIDQAGRDAAARTIASPGPTWALFEEFYRVR